MQNALADKRPSDGYFVEFWRLLVDYPEIIAWDRLFDAAKHEVLAEVGAAVKGVRKNLQIGFHIEHVNSFNPIFRATRSYADLATKADFLKVVVYNNCGGERYANFIRNLGSTVFRDVPKDELLQLQQSFAQLWERSQPRGPGESRALAGLCCARNRTRNCGRGGQMPDPARHRYWNSNRPKLTQSFARRYRSGDPCRAPIRS